MGLSWTEGILRLCRHPLMLLIEENGGQTIYCFLQPNQTLCNIGAGRRVLVLDFSFCARWSHINGPLHSQGRDTDWEVMSRLRTSKSGLLIIAFPRCHSPALYTCSFRRSCLGARSRRQPVSRMCNGQAISAGISSPSFAVESIRERTKPCSNLVVLSTSFQ